MVTLLARATNGRPYKLKFLKGENMAIINYFSNLAIPFTILIILAFGLKENKKVFDIFLEGAKEGIEIVIKLFPTLIGLFVAIGALRASGIINFIADIISPFTNLIGIPKEIMPLALLRPISRKCFCCNWYRHNASIWSG